MSSTRELEKNYLRLTLTSLILACLLFFGGGWLFVKMMNAARYPSAVAAEEMAAAPPADLKLPTGFPMYKSGNVSSVKETEENVVYTIVFSIGSIEQVKEFYKKEMPNHGWQAYAEGSSSRQYLKNGGRQRASMMWQYYAGKPKLRLTLSKVQQEY